MPRVSKEPDVGNAPQVQPWPAHPTSADQYVDVQLDYRNQQVQYVDASASMPSHAYVQPAFAPTSSNWPGPPPGVPMTSGGQYHQQYHMNQPGHQPAAGQPPGQWTWMPAPQTIPGCPPGLEYLMTLDQIHVRQKVHMIESFVNFEKANKYMVVNSAGQFMYLAAENQDYISQNCFGKERPFEMGVYDHMQREVMHIARPWACQACCCACFGLQKMEVQAPPGNPVGFIEQEFSFWGKPKYRILNARREVVLRVEGPWMPCGGNVNFDVTTPDKSAVVGKVTKEWSGFLNEYMTDADNFGISFPVGLDVNVKATLLGMCILIDFNHFEQAASKR